MNPRLLSFSKKKRLRASRSLRYQLSLLPLPRRSLQKVRVPLRALDNGDTYQALEEIEGKLKEQAAEPRMSRTLRQLKIPTNVHTTFHGEEGSFLLCTFWLAQALALAGRTERARTVFERAAAFVNDVGLLAEEVDPASGELLGNFPQAFSHIGLVNAAWAISQAERPASSST